MIFKSRNFSITVHQMDLPRRRPGPTTYPQAEETRQAKHISGKEAPHLPYLTDRGSLAEVHLPVLSVHPGGNCLFQLYLIIPTLR